MRPRGGKEGARARGGRRHGHRGRGGGGCERAARQAVTTEERQVPQEADHHVSPVTLTHTTGTVAKTHSSTLCNYKHKHWPIFPEHASHIGHKSVWEKHTHTLPFLCDWACVDAIDSFIKARSFDLLARSLTCFLACLFGAPLSV